MQSHQTTLGVVIGAVVAAAAFVAASGFLSVAGLNHMGGAPPSLQGAATTPPTMADCLSRLGYRCYSPSQVRNAYGVTPLLKRGITGKGVTVAIVDSFGSPSIRGDLATYDKAFHLPPPPSFRIITPAGKIPPWNPKNRWMPGWATETSLDVEAVHAMAPGASILLVETPVAETIGIHGFPQIVKSENYVINHHLTTIISQSFATAEQTFPSTHSLLKLRSALKNAARHHVTVLAGTGDWGATSPKNVSRRWTYFTKRVANWPSSDPLVTAVGGTALTLNAQGKRLHPDEAWNETSKAHAPQAGGGGRSSIFSSPGYQMSVASVVGSHRGVPDVSLDAAQHGGFLMYRTSGPHPGFLVEGGTSLACPLFAGIVALAQQSAGHPLGLLNPLLYALGSGSSSLPDVRRGNTTVTFRQGSGSHRVEGFTATNGYDLATGLGTVNAARLIHALASQ